MYSRISSVTALVRLNVLMERTLTDIDRSLIDPAMDEASHAAVCGPGRCCKDVGLHRDYCKKGDRSCVRKGREALNLSRGEIMGLNVELLKQSFKLVASQAGALVSPFPERFVQEDQAVKPLFKDASMAEQKLLVFFLLVIKNLKKPEELAERLKAMGLCLWPMGRCWPRARPSARVSWPCWRIRQPSLPTCRNGFRTAQSSHYRHHKRYHHHRRGELC